MNIMLCYIDDEAKRVVKLLEENMAAAAKQLEALKNK